MNPSTPDDDGLVEIAELDGEAEARAAARTLLEHGIGADVVAGGAGAANLIAGTGDRYVVKVLVADQVRAREVLGLPEPEPDEPEATEELDPVARSMLAVITDDKKVHSLLGGRIEATSKQITVVLAIYVLALILLPLAAFFGTQILLDDDITSEVDPSVVTLPLDE